MDTLATTVLQYAVWPSLTFAMLALWTFGMLDIDRHRRSGASTSATLLCMAGCISLVAIFAIAGIGVAFADPWVETVSAAGPDLREADDLRGPARVHLFSFGLENGSYVPADPAGEDRDGGPR